MGLLFFGLSAFAVEDVPQSFTLDGRLFSDANSSTPLNDTGTLKFQVLDNDGSVPASTCVLYEEKQNFNTTTSSGYFNAQVGSAVGSSARTAGDSGNSMALVFSNTAASINGKLLSNGSACTYTPSAGDVRYLRVVMTPSDLVDRPLSPNMALSSVPAALVAERSESLQGISASGFVNINSSAGVTQANVEALFGNYTNLQTLSATPAANYVVKNSNSTVQLPNVTSPSSPQAGEIWYDAGNLKFWNGSSEQTLGTSSGTSQWTTSGSDIYYSTGNVGIGTNAPDTALAVSVAQHGTSTIKVENTLNGSDANASLQAATSGGEAYSSYGGLASTPEWVVGRSYSPYDFRIGRGDKPSDVSDFVISQADGNVGIGTDAPGYTLDINRDSGTGSDMVRIRNQNAAGSSSILYADSANAIQAFTGYGNSGIGAPYADTFFFATNSKPLTFFTDETGVGDGVARMTIKPSTGGIGIGTTAPTAALHLKAGTATAGTAPLKFTSGVLTTTSEPGAMEYDGTNFWLSNGTSRSAIPTSTTPGNLSNTATISNTGSITMIPSAGNSVIVNQSTTSTSSSSGALIVNGGVGIAENLNVGGNTNVTGNTTVTGSVISKGRLETDGGMLFNQGPAATDNLIYLGSSSSGSVNASLGFFAAGVGSSGSSDGPYFLARGNDYSASANQRGNMYFSAGNPSSMGASEGSINFLTDLDRYRMTIANNGNVGIGTTAPATLLDIAGGNSAGTHFEFDPSASSNDYVTRFAMDDTGLKIGHNSPNRDLEFQTNSTTAMTITNDGKVGIGTTSPLNSLHVVASGTQAALVRRDDADNNYWTTFLIGRTRSDATAPSTNFGGALGFQLEGFTNDSAAIAASVGAVWQNAQTDDTTSRNSALLFRTMAANATSEQMRITSAGKIGIGTTNPTAVLQLKAGTATAGTSPLKFTSGVLNTTFEPGAMEYDGTNFWLSNGTARSSIVTGSAPGTLNNTSTISNAGSITMTPSAGNSVIVNQSTTSTSPTSGALIVNGGAGILENLNVGGNITSNGAISAASSTAATASANSSSPSIYLTANYWDGAATAIDRWSIANILGSGTNPTSTLTFSHPTGSTGVKQYSFMDGNVGIGTANPSKLLHVYSSSTDATTIIDNDTLSRLILQSPTSNNSFTLQKNSTDLFTIKSYIGGVTSNPFNITSSGNVGIGTTTPTYALDVTKSTSAAGTIIKAQNPDASDGSYAGFMLQNDQGANNYSQFMTYSSGSIGNLLGVARANRSFLFSTGSSSEGLAVGTVTSDPLILSTNNLERARIDSSGNVGIGTASPTNLLEVGATSTTSSSPTLRIQNYSATQGDASTTFNIAQLKATAGNGAVTGTLMAAYNTPANTTGITLSSNGANPIFLTPGGATPALAVISGGNVGIGTMNPISKLSVASNSAYDFSIVAPYTSGAWARGGSIHFTKSDTTVHRGLSFGLHGGGDTLNGAYFSAVEDAASPWLTDAQLYLKSNGNVGIGTSSPAALLDVAQTMRAMKASEIDPASGTGVEIWYPSAADVGRVAAYDRTASAYKDLYVDGTNLALNSQSGGKVGIHTSTPTANLEVAGTNTDGVLPITFTDNDSTASLASLPLLSAGGGSIGWNLSSGRGEVNFFNRATGGSTKGFSFVQQTGTGTFSTPMVIQGTTGYVGIGSTGPVYPLDVVGDIRTTTCIRTSAGVTGGTCTSDERLKTDIHSFDLGLNALLGIKPKYFKYNGLGGQPASEKDELGVLAQDVEKTAPELVSTKAVKLHPQDKDETQIKVVNYNGLIYMVINSVKELYTKLTTTQHELKREIASLKADNLQLKAESEKQKKENAEIKARLDKIEKLLRSK